MSLTKITALFACLFVFAFLTMPVIAQTSEGIDSSSSSARSTGGSSTSNNNSSSSTSGNTTSGTTTSSSDSSSSSNFSPIPGGVLVNAKGVLERTAVLDFGTLTKRQLAAAKASYSSLPRDVQAKTPLRFVSLNRLEKAVVDANGVLTEEMKYLAGLQRIEYVFYFPESKDIVIAGPAEGWYPGYEGAMVGQSSQQPVCELQDLVAALRAFAPQSGGTDRIGCSIDPTAEGTARLQQFQNDFGSQTTRNRFGEFVDGLKKSLGNQTVRVDGISPNTHAAQMMVAADYRMKRIGIGADPAPVRMETFIERTTPRLGNALFRWYFVPDYEAVVINGDKTALALTSNRVKLVAENELIDADGQTAQKAPTDVASVVYTKSFTRHYTGIAQRLPVFAQLRNFVDMLVAAEFIRQQDFYGKAGWEMKYWGDEKSYPIETFNAPKEVEPVVGQKVRGGTLMAPIGGGVAIEPDEVLENVKADTNGKITKLKESVKIDLPAGAWWWNGQ